MKFTAKLEEPTLAIDPTSGQKSEQLPTYNAFSKDGDVVIPLIVNYGIPKITGTQRRLNVSVKGAIAIARYGRTPGAASKPKVAAEHGAVGCIIYSDPEGDGYFSGETFPKGGFRPSDGVQRGSVADDPIFRVTRSLPAWPRKVPEGRRLSVITKIPVLPISRWRRAAAARRPPRPGRAHRWRRKSSTHLSRRPQHA